MYRVDVQNKQLIALAPTGFAEQNLKERFDIQEWVEKSPEILGEDLLIIAKEHTLSSGRRLDLLAIDKAARLVVVELKRDDSGSSVEWQAIKYTSYCSTWTSTQVFECFAKHAEVSAPEAKKKIEEFIDADIEILNDQQRIILVSREFHPEVASALLWLRDQGVEIQCTRLAPFLDSDGQLFIKPEVLIPLPEAKDYIERKQKKQQAASGPQHEWTGYWFANIGEGEHRTWADSQKFNFLGAGQGKKYADALARLKVGDKLYGYLKGKGYVGRGEVIATAVPIREFKDPNTGKPILQAGLTAPAAAENADDDELCEWVVGVNWLKTVQANQAKTFTGVFANQNIVCKLRHPETLAFVAAEFGE